MALFTLSWLIGWKIKRKPWYIYSAKLSLKWLRANLITWCTIQSGSSLIKFVVAPSLKPYYCNLSLKQHHSQNGKNFLQFLLPPIKETKLVKWDLMELLRKIKHLFIYIKPDKEDQDGLIFGFWVSLWSIHVNLTDSKFS